MTCDCQNTDGDDCTDPVEQVRSALSKRILDCVDTIVEGRGGGVDITFDKGRAINGPAAQDLLEAGWAISNYWRTGENRRQNKFRVTRFNVEEREREVTVTESVVVFDR